VRGYLSLLCLFVIMVSCIRSKEPRPETMAGPDRAICSGSSTVLGTPGSPENSYNWSPSEGLDNPASPQPTATPSQTITYTLTVTDKLTGISATSTVTVYVNPLPQADAGPSRSICAGSSTMLGSQGQAGITYTWSPSAGLNDHAIAQPTASPSTTTTYTLIVVDLLTGCSSTSSTKVIVNPLPSADAGPNRNICAGGSTQVGSSPLAGLSYRWSPSAGLSATTVAQPTASPSTTTTYTLTVQNSLTGCSQSSTVAIAVNPNPQASFSADSPSCLGQSIEFTDTSSSPNGPIATWLWTFGDGLTSTTQNPTHIYGGTGIYSASLLVTDPQGCKNTALRSITVSIVSASFTLTTPTCSLSSIQFIDTSSSVLGSISSWLWDFGDGATSTTQNPTHVYASDGDFPVDLIVTNAAECFSSATSTIPVNSSPKASFLSNSPQYLGSSIKFTDSSTPAGTILQWLWGFGDGTTSTTQNPSHRYCTPGTYGVSLTVTGCSLSTVTQNVTVATFVTTISNISNSSGTSQGSVITSDLSGVTHVVWSDNTPGNWDVFYISKPITGGTWTSPTNISKDSGVSSVPRVAFDTLGNIHALWQDNTSGWYRIYYSYKPQSGSWITPTSIYNPVYSSTFPSVCADSANNLHVFWSEWLATPVGRNEIYYSWKAPAGSWSAPVNISNSSSSSYVARCVVDSQNGLHVVWENNSPGAYDIFYTTKPYGGSWTAPVNISNNTGDSQAPVIARDFQDTLHVVWFDNSPGNNEILYIFKATAGTWSTPENISLSSGDSLSPAIGFDSTGMVHIVYSDNICGNYDVYYLNKSYGGTWGSLINLSYSTGQSTNPDLAIDINDGVHIVWEDNTPGNYDIFYITLP